MIEDYYCVVIYDRHPAALFRYYTVSNNGQFIKRSDAEHRANEWNRNMAHDGYANAFVTTNEYYHKHLSGKAKMKRHAQMTAYERLSVEHFGECQTDGCRFKFTSNHLANTFLHMETHAEVHNHIVKVTTHGGTLHRYNPEQYVGQRWEVIHE